MAFELTLDIWFASHVAVFDLLTAGSSAPSLKIFDSSDTLLAEIAIDVMASSVSEATAEITLMPDGREESAPADGVASYVQIHDGDDTAKLRLPCVFGTTAVAGYVVMNPLSIAIGQPVEVLAISIPPGNILI